MEGYVWPFAAFILFPLSPSSQFSFIRVLVFEDQFCESRAIEGVQVFLKGFLAAHAPRPTGPLGPVVRATLIASLVFVYS